MAQNQISKKKVSNSVSMGYIRYCGLDDNALKYSLTHKRPCSHTSLGTYMKETAVYAYEQFYNHHFVTSFSSIFGLGCPLFKIKGQVTKYEHVLMTISTLNLLD